MAKEVRESLVFEYEGTTVVDAPGMQKYYGDDLGQFPGKNVTKIVLNTKSNLKKGIVKLVENGALRALKRTFGPKKQTRLKFSAQLYLYTEEAVNIFLKNMGLDISTNVITRHLSGEYIPELVLPEEVVEEEDFDYHDAEIRENGSVLEISYHDFARIYYSKGKIRWERLVVFIKRADIKVESEQRLRTEFIPLTVALKVLSDRVQKTEEQYAACRYFKERLSGVVSDENRVIVAPENIHCQIDNDGLMWINAEDAARGLGFVDIHAKKDFATSGEKYETVRWARVNGYLKEFGYSKQVGKDDYIPENMFYRLAMKANNQVAQNFQAIVCDKILPDLRRKWAAGKTYEQSLEEIEVREPSSPDQESLSVEHIRTMRQSLKERVTELLAFTPEEIALLEYRNASDPILEEIKVIRESSLRAKARISVADFIQKIRDEYGIELSYKSIMRELEEEGISRVKNKETLEIPVDIAEEIREKLIVAK